MSIVDEQAQLRKAAEAGDSVAENELAISLAEQGKTQEAEIWWRKAAEAGDWDAADNLGMLLQLSAPA